MRGGLLHVAQQHVGIQRGGNERAAQRMRPGRLGDSGASGHPADDPGGAMPVQPPPIHGEEDRPLGPFADGPRRPQCQRDRDDLASLADDGQRPVTAFQAEGPLSAPVASETRRPDGIKTVLDFPDASP